jgi:hypothetical protein
MLSTSVVWPPTAPAPDSHVPHRSAFGRRYCRYRQPVLPTFTPVTGTEDFASGHASNVFRRSAARISGMHATPAPFFTLSSRGSTTLSQIPRNQILLVAAPVWPSEDSFSVRLLHRLLAVPPPHFHLHVFSRRCLDRSELPLRTHSSRSLFRSLYDCVSLFGLQWALG